MPERMPHLTIPEFFTDEKLPLVLLRRSPQQPYPLHTHQFSELVVITKGKGVHFTENAEYEVRAGDAFVVHGDQAHGYRDLDNLILVNILFDRDLLGIPMADLRTLSGYHALFKLEPQYREAHRFESRLRISSRQMEHVLALVDLLENEIKEKEPGYVFQSTAFFMQVIGFLSRCYSNSEAPELQSVLRIGEIISHMEHHYAGPITLSHLARVGHMSKSSLQRAFKDATGFSPIDYLIRLRVGKACEWLKNSSLTVTEIAFKVGFTDSNYFTRQFTKIRGIAPREFRRQAMPHN